ncbi:MAG: hypothetical protein WCR56_00470 [Bacilli bacterium]|jgi:hypothetical protein
MDPIKLNELMKMSDKDIYSYFESKHFSGPWDYDYDYLVFGINLIINKRLAPSDYEKWFRKATSKFIYPNTLQMLFHKRFNKYQYGLICDLDDIFECYRPEGGCIYNDSMISVAMAALKEIDFELKSKSEQTVPDFETDGVIRYVVQKSFFEDGSSALVDVLIVDKKNRTYNLINDLIPLFNKDYNYTSLSEENFDNNVILFKNMPEYHLDNSLKEAGHILTREEKDNDRLSFEQAPRF